MGGLNEVKAGGGLLLSFDKSERACVFVGEMEIV